MSRAVSSDSWPSHSTLRGSERFSSRHYSILVQLWKQCASRRPPVAGVGQRRLGAKRASTSARTRPVYTSPLYGCSRTNRCTVVRERVGQEWSGRRRPGRGGVLAGTRRRVRRRRAFCAAPTAATRVRVLREQRGSVWTWELRCRHGKRFASTIRADHTRAQRGMLQPEPPLKRHGSGSSTSRRRAGHSSAACEGPTTVTGYPLPAGAAARLRMPDLRAFRLVWPPRPGELSPQQLFGVRVQHSYDACRCVIAGGHPPRQSM